MATKPAAKKVTKRPAVAVKKKKGVSGSAKGAAFERLIAKELSLWISEGKNPDLLWRSAGSGGRSTMRRKQTGKGIDNHESDIAPLHEDAKPFSDMFATECKFYKSLNVSQLFYYSSDCVVSRWWRQACLAAGSVDKIPLLIMKENGHEPLLMFYCVPPLLDALKAANEFGACNWIEFHSLGVVVCNFTQLRIWVPFKVFKKAYHDTLPCSNRFGSAPDRPRRRRLSLDDL